MYFSYGETETAYLKHKDKKLGAVIDQLGPIHRPVDTDLFSSVVHHIIGQQISTKAQQTIWNRIQQELGEVNADTLLTAGRERLQSFGMTFKKADYILDFARKVNCGQFDLDAIAEKSDAEAFGLYAKALREFDRESLSAWIVYLLSMVNIRPDGTLTR